MSVLKDKIKEIRGVNRELLKHPDGSVFADGYGQISKLVMRDKKLTVEAKSIYAYLCSYCGGGDCAYPGIELICKDLRISVKRYYKHFKMLEDSGYVHVAKIRTAENQYERNVYMLEYVLKKKRAKKL